VGNFEFLTTQNRALLQELIIAKLVNKFTTFYGTGTFNTVFTTACHRYPLDRRLGGPQSRSGHGGEEKNSQPLPGLEPPIIQPVAHSYTTESSRIIGNEYTSL
jgi:hypothetical protein